MSYLFATAIDNNRRGPVPPVCIPPKKCPRHREVDQDIWQSLYRSPRSGVDLRERYSENGAGPPSHFSILRGDGQSMARNKGNGGNGESVSPPNTTAQNGLDRSGVEEVLGVSLHGLRL